MCNVFHMPPQLVRKVGFSGQRNRRMTGPEILAFGKKQKEDVVKYCLPALIALGGTDLQSGQEWFAEEEMDVPMSKSQLIKNEVARALSKDEAVTARRSKARRVSKKAKLATVALAEDGGDGGGNGDGNDEDDEDDSDNSDADEDGDDADAAPAADGEEHTELVESGFVHSSSTSSSSSSTSSSSSARTEQEAADAANRAPPAPSDWFKPFWPCFVMLSHPCLYVCKEHGDHQPSDAFLGGKVVDVGAAGTPAAAASLLSRKQQREANSAAERARSGNNSPMLMLGGGSSQSELQQTMAVVRESELLSHKRFLVEQDLLRETYLLTSQKTPAELLQERIDNLKDMLSYIDDEEEKRQVRQEVLVLLKEKRELLQQPNVKRFAPAPATSSFAAHVHQLNEQSEEAVLGGSYAMSLSALAKTSPIVAATASSSSSSTSTSSGGGIGSSRSTAVRTPALQVQTASQPPKRLPVGSLANATTIAATAAAAALALYAPSFGSSTTSGTSHAFLRPSNTTAAATTTSSSSSSSSSSTTAAATTTSSSGSSTNAAAFASTNNNRGCSKCGKSGHTHRYCTKPDE